MKKPLLILTGPTAVGKTALSIRAAKAFGGEIISADSMQVYQYMDIGSAKVTKEEMAGIPHHLIDVLLPEESFHVVKFQRMAKEAMNGIYERGHLPILTGGTGFYIQALLYDIDFTENDADAGYREKLEKLAEERGAGYLHQMLRERDAQAAEDIHENNIKRVIRALEFFEKTGKPISEHNQAEREKESPYQFAYVVLFRDRTELYKRIDRRVDKMMEEGLLDEVRQLKNMGYTRDMVSMQGLGYKELLAYLDGETTLSEAVRILKRDTRHFAKRQLTWFKRERQTDWISMDDRSEEAILSEIEAIMRKRMITPGRTDGRA
ncbi:tRNA (adenosine(37)-N6)-dimethylallyltransferase MiaA [Qiania dongpingensis]|uniref:tRNA dimethylallyltransferase n=1 Tax=Qiania dongpingensis TaxID=2763669 RepID=A0A7G9G4U8_9FIRM|nr:tRNA (adenosine(37)-N6)-dimethylallyltransferase MiaA [Qiania dongpingensis]QNM05830.1 tRNA (adenosine(37)-N6)-dimethylallyltransferase MiaA [Qiania dongpingensis]